jgi:hypothetical protein
MLRRRMLGWWKRKVTTIFLEWIREEHLQLQKGGKLRSKLVQEKEGVYQWTLPSSCNSKLGGLAVYKVWWEERQLLGGNDLRPGTDAIERAARSTWWNWDDGSRPFHWRWPKWYKKIIRDGLPVHFRAENQAIKRRSERLQTRPRGNK